ncbi:hypothetical protein IWQ52_002206 [Labrenzia sp. EL_159]|nr:hypothetical protein [Labrenzia sp. EL_162]MBG6194692.1 hypothetical protein [Labrenzia sp. EL_159]
METRIFAQFDCNFFIEVIRTKQVHIMEKRRLSTALYLDFQVAWNDERGVGCANGTKFRDFMRINSFALWKIGARERKHGRNGWSAATVLLSSAKAGRMVPLKQVPETIAEPE